MRSLCYMAHAANLVHSRCCLLNTEATVGSAYPAGTNTSLQLVVEHVAAVPHKHTPGDVPTE